MLIKGAKINLWIIVIFLFCVCDIAFSNPIIDPHFTIGSIMVLVSTIGLESAIAAILLCFLGMAPVQTLCAMLFLNVITFGFMVFGLLEVIQNIIIIEALIIVVEVGFIKFLCRFDVFQLEFFQGIGWLGAFVVSTLSNIASYFVGNILSARF